MNYGIIVFTKDRLNTLEKILPILQSTEYRIIIIDDSCVINNRKQVRSIAEVSRSTIYFGIEEYNLLIHDYKLGHESWRFLLRRPGIKEWNLGYMRNLALILTRHYKLDRVAFIDDDIVVTDIHSFRSLYKELDQFAFSGPEIVGLRDDSIIGHIAHRVGYSEERLLSGGCIFFSPGTVKHYFLNIYNEDWIWLLLHCNEGMNFTMKQEVYQLYNDPFESFGNKIEFQEQGEVLLNCLLKAQKNGVSPNLVETDCWNSVIIHRVSFLDSILMRHEIQHEDVYYQIVNTARSIAINLTGEQLRALITAYYEKLDMFQKLYHSL